MQEPTVVLGLETSCDDTAAAIVRRNGDGSADVLSNEIWTNHDDHAAFGGIVPEIAARSHVERIDHTIARALKTANLSMSSVDAVAATAGPGLLGGVMVGLTAGKALALTHDKPLIALNHLEGHALSARLTEPISFPYLLLLISGGHTQLVAVHSVGNYERLGTTIDDAAGEAFDKTAKLLGLGQPGGPKIEVAARDGNDERFQFPLPLAKKDGCNFSFSGLKTAVRECADAINAPTTQDVSDIAAGFQRAVARHLATQSAKAMAQWSHSNGSFVIAGGVAANQFLRATLNAECAKRDWKLYAPPLQYCTDNGAMIAWAGAEIIAERGVPNQTEMLAFAPRARWPLAPPPIGGAIGYGRKGPKA